MFRSFTSDKVICHTYSVSLETASKMDSLSAQLDGAHTAQYAGDSFQLDHSLLEDSQPKESLGKESHVRFLPTASQHHEGNADCLEKDFSCKDEVKDEFERVQACHTLSNHNLSQELIPSEPEPLKQFMNDCKINFSPQHSSSRSVDCIPHCASDFTTNLTSVSQHFNGSASLNFLNKTGPSKEADVCPGDPCVSLHFPCKNCSQQFSQVDDLLKNVCNHPINTEDEMNILSVKGDSDSRNSVQDYPHSLSGISHSGEVLTVEEPSSPSSNFRICENCDVKFSSTYDYLDHMKQNHSSLMNQVAKNITCEFCPLIFSHEGQLLNHQARHPFGTPAIQCSKCGEILGNYTLLKEHRQYEDYLSSCDICGRLFPNEECMVYHIRNFHSDFPDNFDEGEDEEKQNEFGENITQLQDSNNKELPTTDVSPFGDAPDVTIQETGHGDDCTQHSLNNKVHYAHEQSIRDRTSEEKHLSQEYDNHNTEGDTKYGVLEVTNDKCYEEPLENQRCSSSSSKQHKVKCQFCSKKCSTRKSLVRHERSHSYGTEAIKCNLCLEMLKNYKALKVHKKHQGGQVSCSICCQMFPNEGCLTCHLKNVHNSLGKSQSSWDSDLSNDSSNSPNLMIRSECEESEDEHPTPQYSVSRCTGSDPGAPLRITIKQEREDTHVNKTDTYMYSSSTPPTPSTPSPQGPPTPSPPDFVEESGPSDEESDDNYEPYEIDQSLSVRNKRVPRRKSSLRTKEKISSNLLFLSSSEESDLDESPDFKYDPQSFSESEDDSDEDVNWKKEEGISGSRKKRAPRRRGPLSDEDSDFDPGWKNVHSSAMSAKKRGRHRKFVESDDDSGDDPEWLRPLHLPQSSKKRSIRKKGPFSDDDSDKDPDWMEAVDSTQTVKKKTPGKRGRRKKMQVAFVIPSFVETKIKRSRARGCGGQKAQDAASALAEAVDEMESSVPEIKVVIKPLKRSHGGSITKASVKRFGGVFDCEYDYLLDVKPEPMALSDESEPKQSTDLGTAGDLKEEIRDVGSADNIHIPAPEADEKIWDQQQEQIVIKAEPYDFQDDDEDDDDLSRNYDLYSRGRSLSSTTKYETNNCSPDNVDHHIGSSDEKRELRYVCKICGRELQYRSHLLRHLRKVHGGQGVDEVMRRLMKCRFCSKPYSNELSLINHEKLHDGTNKIKCNKCDDVFDDKNALRRHQRKIHWEHQPVECEVCKKQLADNTCLKAHMKHMHASEERKATVFTCEACGKQLHTKTAFQNHVASKCGTNLLFPCETCGKSFSFKGSLKAHQLLHTGVKSFLCKFCGKAFHQKGEMKRHERKHTGEKPFVCEVCGRAFAYRESLLGHSAVHTGIKPFPCKSCGLRFSCSGNLVKHRRSNNCKGFGMEGENAAVSASHEMPLGNMAVSLSTSDNTSVSLPQEKTTNVFSVTACIQEVSDKDNAKPVEVSTAPTQQKSHFNVANECESSNTDATNVMKVPPVINVKPTTALQSSPKETKPVSYPNTSQSYVTNNVGNQRLGHLSTFFENLDHSSTGQNNYSSPNLVSSVNENNLRQANQVNLSDRRFSHFNIDTGYTGRTDQYLDSQSVMQREMSRQVIERSMDRQAPRFLDCFGGVQFSSTDARNTIQSYPPAPVPHTATYHNIHSGHLSPYAASHSANHASGHVNVYGSNSMMTGPVSFPAFTANNHIGMSYTPNNPIPAHSVPHTNSFPNTHAHMSHFEALFGHLSHPGVHASSTFPRLSSHSMGSATSNPSNNHRL